MVFSFLVVVFSLIAFLCNAAGRNALLSSGVSGPCHPAGSSYASLCYPTRCFHLFNFSETGVLTPTPNDSDPQDYLDFGCEIITQYIYAADIPSEVCLVAQCYCKTLPQRGSCHPAKLANCWRHNCTL